MKPSRKVLLISMTLLMVSCQHISRPCWGEQFGDLPAPRDGEIQQCIASVSTPSLLWISESASVSTLEDTLGTDFFKQYAPDRLYILRRAGSRGRWMRWLKYDFSGMTPSEKGTIRLHHGDYIYFWSTKTRPAYLKTKL